MHLFMKNSAKIEQELIAWTEWKVNGVGWRKMTDQFVNRTVGICGRGVELASSQNHGMMPKHYGCNQY